MGINDLSSAIENIEKIKKTKLISKQNKIILVLIFIAHWLFMGGIATYFIWGQPKYDIYLICCLPFLIITWKLFGDCSASYYEKKIIKDIINIDYIRNPSLNLFCYNNNITIIIEIVVSFLMNFNFGYIMIRNNMPTTIVFIYLIWATYSNIYHRREDLLKIYEVKKIKI